jgi:hypothetical protein
MIGMDRYQIIPVTFFVSLFLLCSIGAFLLYVPAMSWIAVSVILLGMALVFLLGVIAGGRRIRIARLKHASEWRKLIPKRAA